MPNFSEHSKRELSTCDKRLQEIGNKLIERYNFKVLEGHRSKKRQNRLYREEKSQLKYPESKHNKKPSKAFDIAPWPVDWKKLNRFYFMAGHVMSIAYDLEYDIRWGGDWDSDHKFDDNQFDDLPHFEID